MKLDWLLECVKQGFVTVKEALELIKWLEWIEERKKQLEKWVGKDNGR